MAVVEVRSKTLVLHCEEPCTVRFHDWIAQGKGGVVFRPVGRLEELQTVHVVALIVHLCLVNVDGLYEIGMCPFECLTDPIRVGILIEELARNPGVQPVQSLD